MPEVYLEIKVHKTTFLFPMACDMSYHDTSLYIGYRGSIFNPETKQLEYIYCFAQSKSAINSINLIGKPSDAEQVVVDHLQAWLKS